MKKPFCEDCDKEVEIYIEPVNGGDYISCPHCGRIFAKLDYHWKLPNKQKKCDCIMSNGLMRSSCFDGCGCPCHKN